MKPEAVAALEIQLQAAEMFGGTKIAMSWRKNRNPRTIMSDQPVRNVPEVAGDASL
jgi:hypothetical protein